MLLIDDYFHCQFVSVLFINSTHATVVHQANKTLIHVWLIHTRKLIFTLRNSFLRVVYNIFNILKNVHTYITVVLLFFQTIKSIREYELWDFEHLLN